MIKNTRLNHAFQPERTWRAFCSLLSITTDAVVNILPFELRPFFLLGSSKPFLWEAAHLSFTQGLCDCRKQDLCSHTHSYPPHGIGRKHSSLAHHYMKTFHFKWEQQCPGESIGHRQIHTWKHRPDNQVSPWGQSGLLLKANKFILLEFIWIYFLSLSQKRILTDKMK